MLAKEKFAILTEGQRLGVSDVCKKHHISRTLYYRWLNRYKAMGLEGLEEIKRTASPLNKTQPAIELTLLELVKRYPTYGPKALNYLLEEYGYGISESAVYNILKRNNLSQKHTRLAYAKALDQGEKCMLPPKEDLICGESWVFWIIDYGVFDQVGRLYEYTFYDLKSRIACSRLYQGVQLDYFEDTLSGVAMPVAQHLNFDTKHLCLLHESTLLKKQPKRSKHRIRTFVKQEGFDVTLVDLSLQETTTYVDQLKKAYTQGCLDVLMPLLTQGLDLKSIKHKFQHHIRAYNLSHKQTYLEGAYSPVDYHQLKTGTKLILPLWAYLDRDY